MRDGWPWFHLTQVPKVGCYFQACKWLSASCASQWALVLPPGGVLYPKAFPVYGFCIESGRCDRLSPEGPLVSLKAAASGGGTKGLASHKRRAFLLIAPSEGAVSCSAAAAKPATPTMSSLKCRYAPPERCASVAQ